MRTRLSDTLGCGEATTASIVSAYREASPKMSPSDLFFRATSDHMMRIPAILQAERKAAQGGAPAYLYLFSWESPFMGGRMKAHHGAELPFVFDTVEANRALQRGGRGKRGEARDDVVRHAEPRRERSGQSRAAGHDTAGRGLIPVRDRRRGRVAVSGSRARRRCAP